MGSSCCRWWANVVVAGQGTIGTGPIYQGRFKAFAACTNRYLLTLLRYAERNAQAAGLVEHARDWPYSSLHQRLNSSDGPVLLSPWPVGRPANWVEIVEADTDYEHELELRQSIERGVPFGPKRWRNRMAKELGLDSTLKPRKPYRRRRDAR
jgi:putative transposase